MCEASKTKLSDKNKRCNINNQIGRVEETRREERRARECDDGIDKPEDGRATARASEESNTATNIQGHGEWEMCSVAVISKHVWVMQCMEASR